MGVFIIGYDIRQPRRLQRVHRAMKAYAAPIEYSVFLLEGSVQDAHRCMEEIVPLIHPEDEVCCYPLPASGWQARLGKAVLPEGILWTGLPAPEG